MKTQYEQCREWLRSGKTLTQKQSYKMFGMMGGFRTFIYRFKKQLEKEGKELVNLHENLGIYGKYKIK